MKSSRNLLIATVLIVVASLATYLLYRSEKAHQQEMQEALSQPLVLPDPARDPERADEKQLVSIFVYRPSGSLAGRPTLQKMETEIPWTSDRVQLALRVVSSVLEASHPLVPPEARAHQVFLKDDMAVVDLSRETSEQMIGGIESEYGLLQSLTRSLRENLPEINKVHFLVDGNEQPTFSGHISIRLPFS